MVVKWLKEEREGGEEIRLNTSGSRWEFLALCASEGVPAGDWRRELCLHRQKFVLMHRSNN